MKAALLRLGSGIADWCRAGFRPEPVAGWEWFLLRLLFAVVVWMSFANDGRPYTFADQPAPNSIARFIDLTWLYQPELQDDEMSMQERILWMVGPLLLLYLSGRLLWISLPLLTILCTIVHSYSNSQGFIFHGYQIVGLTLLVQAVLAVYWRIQTWRGRDPFPKLPDVSPASWMEYYSRGAILATYVVSALTKIGNSKGMWVWNSRYIPMELIKSNRLEYFRTLDPQYAGDIPIATWMIQHPWITRMMFSSGFFLELFALVGLHSRKWGLVTGIAIISFHRIVLYLMTLTFEYNEYLLVIFCINPPFWIWWAWQRMRGRGGNVETLAESGTVS